jgi:cytidylate kinase
MIITIDAPAASGKSTLAKALAHKINFYYFSTGMLYRGVAYVLIHMYKKDITDFALLTQRSLSFISLFSYFYYTLLQI